MSVEIAVIAGMIMILCGRFMGRFYEDPKVWPLLYMPSLVFAWGVATVVREPLYSFLDEFGFELWFATLCYILLILGLGYLSVKITEFVSRDEDVERSKDRWNRKTEMTHVTHALKPHNRVDKKRHGRGGHICEEPHQWLDPSRSERKSGRQTGDSRQNSGTR